MITIENINGKDYTVVWNNEYDAKALENVPLDFTGNDEAMLIANGVLALHQLGEWFATALPALPRYPENNEATIRLLHLYQAHGLKVCGKAHLASGGVYEFSSPTACIEYLKEGVLRVEITHATFNGERVEIAIEENE